MTTVKTVLECPYQPADFFEAPYRRSWGDCEILVDAGIATVTFARPHDPLPESLKSRIESELDAIFCARQLRTHRQFHVGSPTTSQYTTDGSKSIAINISNAACAVTGGSVDIVLTDSVGNVIRDSRAERIAADTSFVDDLAPKISRSPLLGSLLNSYGAAVQDPANELVYLYEIRDALARHYGGEKEARTQLGIAEQDWNHLGRLANAEPVAQSRHRGRHLTGVRPATEAELQEARVIARHLITAFAKTV